jgi:hypothetical protein
MNDSDHLKISGTIERDGIGIVGDDEPHEYAHTYYGTQVPVLMLLPEIKLPQTAV